MKITVKCYSGHRGDQTPRSIQFDSLVVEVKEVQDRWISTDHRYFKILGDDDATYIIRQDTLSQDWELTYFRQAEDLDQRRVRGEPLGPLAGVPVSIKDNFTTSFGTTTCGSRMLDNFVPPYDATLIQRFGASGAVLLGKTNTPELTLSFETNSPLFGPNLDEIGPRFPDMGRAYSRALSELARQVAEENDIPLQEGVYVCLAGPSFETPADLRFLKAIGVDAVGMSTVPEVTVARHGDMRVLGLSTISNKANLDGETITSHEEVLEAGQIVMPRLTRIVEGVLRRL